MHINFYTTCYIGNEHSEQQTSKKRRIEVFDILT